MPGNVAIACQQELLPVSFYGEAVRRRSAVKDGPPVLEAMAPACVVPGTCPNLAVC